MSDFKGCVQVESSRVRQAVAAYFEQQEVVRAYTKGLLKEFKENYKPKRFFSTKCPTKYLNSVCNWHTQGRMVAILTAKEYGNTEGCMSHIDSTGWFIDDYGLEQPNLRRVMMQLRDLSSVGGVCCITPEQAKILTMVELGDWYL